MAGVMLFWSLEVKEAVKTHRSFARRTHMSWSHPEACSGSPASQLEREVWEGKHFVPVLPVQSTLRLAELRRREQYQLRYYC